MPWPTVNQIRLEKKYLSQGVIRAFPGELRQVFLNLIGNAIQAMPSGGTLRLRGADILDPITQRRGITISVTDTGAGIGAEEARRIFQPFFSTKGAKGTGLGLWISRGIVQKYEGRIAFRTLRSPAGEGACTCFRVFLPIIGDVGTPPGREQDVQAAGGVRAIA